MRGRAGEQTSSGDNSAAPGCASAACEGAKQERKTGLLCIPACSVGVRGPGCGGDAGSQSRIPPKHLGEDAASPQQSCSCSGGQKQFFAQISISGEPKGHDVLSHVGKQPTETITFWRFILCIYSWFLFIPGWFFAWLWPRREDSISLGKLQSDSGAAARSLQG